MIPHILQFNWLGGKPVPNIIKSWINNHKNWEVKIWTEENLKLSYINNHINDIHKKRYNQKSDIIRLELLYRYGGVYVDTDILSIKNIECKIREAFIINKANDISKGFYSKELS